jgi:hypothetical protein
MGFGTVFTGTKSEEGIQAPGTYATQNESSLFTRYVRVEAQSPNMTPPGTSPLFVKLSLTN